MPATKKPLGESHDFECQALENAVTHTVCPRFWAYETHAVRVTEVMPLTRHSSSACQETAVEGASASEGSDTGSEGGPADVHDSSHPSEQRAKLPQGWPLHIFSELLGAGGVWSAALLYELNPLDGKSTQLTSHADLFLGQTSVFWCLTWLSTVVFSISREITASASSEIGLGLPSRTRTS